MRTPAIRQSAYVVAGLAVAFWIAAIVLTRADAPVQGSPGVLRAQRIEIVDKQGRVRATLGVTDEDIPKLRMMDKNGETRAAMSLSEDGRPTLTFSDKEAQKRIELNVTEEHRASLSLYGPDNKDAAGAVYLSVSGDGGAYLDMHGPKKSSVDIIADNEKCFVMVIGKEGPKTLSGDH